MLDKNTVHMLRQLLDTISEVEMIVDQQRQELNANPNFAPYTVFTRVDLSNRERISAHDLLGYFQQKGLTGISVGECGKVIKKFDRDGDGWLTYEDFCDMVLTCKNRQLRCEAQQRHHSRVGKFENLPQCIEQQLVAILHSEVDLGKRVQLMVRDLKRRPDFSVYNCFREIDKHNEQVINERNINEFFKLQGIQLIPQEVQAIIRRMSTSSDPRISIDEFAAFLGEPICLKKPGKPVDGSYMYEHRAQEFQTVSKLEANIDRSLKKMHHPCLKFDMTPHCNHQQHPQQSMSDLIKQTLENSARLRHSTASKIHQH